MEVLELKMSRSYDLNTSLTSARNPCFGNNSTCSDVCAVCWTLSIYVSNSMLGNLFQVLVFNILMRSPFHQCLLIYGGAHLLNIFFLELVWWHSYWCDMPSSWYHVGSHVCSSSSKLYMFRLKFLISQSIERTFPHQ